MAIDFECGKAGALFWDGSFGCSAFVELRPTWLMGGVSVDHSP